MEGKINLRWRKSSYSGNGGGNCVEVADQAACVLVRDTQDPTGPVLRFAPDAWRGFADRLKQSLVSGPSRCLPCLLGHRLSAHSSAKVSIWRSTSSVAVGWASGG